MRLGSEERGGRLWAIVPTRIMREYMKSTPHVAEKLGGSETAVQSWQSTPTCIRTDTTLMAYHCNMSRVLRLYALDSAT